MVIKSDDNKKMFSLSDIAKSLSDPCVLNKFSDKIKSYFELEDNIVEKNNYEKLIKKSEINEESPLLYKSRSDIYLYYDLLSGKFKLFTNWNKAKTRPLLEYYLFVLVGVDNFADFVKRNYDPNDPFIVYSEDNKGRNWQNRKEHPKRFEVVDIDKILNLLQKKFESQYQKNLKTFLVDNPDSLKFSSKINEEVFPFFLKSSLEYKVQFFSRNYNHFCKDYKLKDEFWFLKDVHNSFKEWNLRNCYSGKVVVDDLIYDLKKSETDIEKEISKIVEGQLVRDQEELVSDETVLEKSKLINEYLRAIATKFRGVGRPNSDYVINWDYVLSVYGNAVSKFILDSQDKRDWYLDLFEPHRDRRDGFTIPAVFTKYLSTDYAKGKTYKFDLNYLVNNKADPIDIELQVKSLIQILEGGANIELTMFHKPVPLNKVDSDSVIYTLLSKCRNSTILFEDLLNLSDNLKKRIIFKKSEIETIKSLVNFNLLVIPTIDFFERLEEFTLI